MSFAAGETQTQRWTLLITIGGVLGSEARTA